MPQLRLCHHISSARQPKIYLHSGTDPKRTLWDATADRGQLFGEHDDINSLGTEVETETQVAADSVAGVRRLGSGSDYTVFLQHLGVLS